MQIELFFQILCILIGTFTSFLLFSNYTDKQKHIPLFLTIFCSYALLNIVYLYISIPALHIIFNITVVAVIIQIFTNGSIFFKLELIILFMAVNTLADTFVGLFVFLFYPDVFHNTPGMLYYIIDTFIQILGFMLINAYVHIHKHNTQQSFSWKYTAIIIFLTVLYLIIGQAIVITCMQNNILPVFAIVGILSILALNYFTFFLYDELQKYYDQKLEWETLALQESYYAGWYEDMKQSFSEMQSFQHDVNNQITILQGMILAQTAATSVTNRSFESLQSIFSRLQLFEPTNNLVVDTLLQSKCQRAKTYGITIKCDIAVPSDIEFDSINFVSIFGNLLDNAIEAVKDIAEESEKVIFFKLRYTLPNLIFLIRNPYCGTLDMEKKDGEIQFRSTKTNVSPRELHGIGLKNVKKSIEQYQGIMNIRTEKQIFVVEGMLMNYGEKQEAEENI
jgi:hypothetical protein